MFKIDNILKLDFESVPMDTFWNTGSEKEFKMHRIHAYPAKFPAFITTKALEFAKIQGHKVIDIADIFCGCGTTAFEAKRNDINFWGCDINPVATLIAKTKSHKYQKGRLENYFNAILDYFFSTPSPDRYDSGSERLRYWFKREQFNDLANLKDGILLKIPDGSSYQTFFLCAFSNILKGTSVWLTKSIKPQVDKYKNSKDVITAFKEQFRFMYAANDEIKDFGSAKTDIITGSFLLSNVKPPQVDMIITSPPYVTSYEYADLHQLSSLWLGFTDDYRDLRRGSIGSLYHEYNFTREWKRLNSTGNRVVSMLLDKDKSISHSVAKYYLDMQIVARRSFDMVKNKGLAVYVIGNTEYKNVRIDNAKHLAESLKEVGFNDISVTKRKISKKILTPYRDNLGKFSANKNSRKVYSEEFIVVGRR